MKKCTSSCQTETSSLPRTQLCIEDSQSACQCVQDSCVWGPGGLGQANNEARSQRLRSPCLRTGLCPCFYTPNSAAWDAGIRSVDFTADLACSRPNRAHAAHAYLTSTAEVDAAP